MGTDVHFLWNGRDRLDAIIGSWRKRLARLFELAEVPKGYAHRFRDTFAVELLLAGCANRKSLSSPGTPKREDYRAPLFALGTRSPRAARTGFEARLGTRPCGAHGNEGYTRGTRKKWKV
jgi:integrase